MEVLRDSALKLIKKVITEWEVLQIVSLGKGYMSGNIIKNFMSKDPGGTRFSPTYSCLDRLSRCSFQIFSDYFGSRGSVYLPLDIHYLIQHGTGTGMADLSK